MNGEDLSLTEYSGSEFKIKYDGQPYQIDANVFINSLLHTTKIIQEINTSLDSGKKISVQIKALDKGSFLVHLALDESTWDTVKNLLTKENITFAGVIITMLVNVITLKRFLKSDKAEVIKSEKNKVTIKNSKGKTIIIDNRSYEIYRDNIIVRDSLEQNFDTLSSDPSITGYEIIDEEDKPLLRVSSDEFPSLTVKSEEVIEGEKIVTESARLNIVRLSFDEKLKWEFYYKGNKISAWLRDPEFQIRIDKGESFAKGDVLEVELEIKKVFNEAV